MKRPLIERSPDTIVLETPNAPDVYKSTWLEFKFE